MSIYLCTDFPEKRRRTPYNENSPYINQNNKKKVNEENWNLPLSYDEIIEIAKFQFKNNQEHQEIIREIKTSLNNYKILGSIQLIGHDKSCPSDADQAVKRAVHDFFIKTDLFSGVEITMLI